jgi:hypothetical protein
MCERAPGPWDRLREPGRSWPFGGFIVPSRRLALAPFLYPVA